MILNTPAMLARRFRRKCAIPTARFEELLVLGAEQTRAAEERV
jgi:hypothetical protein